MTEKLEIIETINPEWIDFYKTRLTDFNIGKFELLKTWKEDSLLHGNILADFDTNFNFNHEEFLINSPTNSEYIDLDYYLINITQNENNELICAGYDVDQEINWVNRMTKTIRRLNFNGSVSTTEDARWINDSNIVLFGINENKLSLEFINLKTLEFEYFIYPELLTHSESYSELVRLRNVKFE